MEYKYSICHSDRKDIEYPQEKLSKNQVMEMVQNYPWFEKVKAAESHRYYSPSLEFTHMNDNKSLTFTAHQENNELMFSLWYLRAVMTNVLFGLFGAKEKMRVIDKWSFTKEESIKYLELFLNKDYKRVEELMTK